MEEEEEEEEEDDHEEDEMDKKKEKEKAQFIGHFRFEPAAQRGKCSMIKLRQKPLG